MKNKLLLLLWICFVFLWHCSQDAKFYESKKSLNNQWSKSDTVSFKVPNNKDNGIYSIYFVLRNNNDYPFSNIYLLTELETPKGNKMKDTLEYQLAYPDGEWIGNGMGGVKQNTLVYKENFAFPDSGNYKIKVIQGMRKDPLIGLEDLSLIIEKNDNGNSKQ